LQGAVRHSGVRCRFGHGDWTTGEELMRFLFGDCDLDTNRYELRRAGQAVALEPKAFRVLV
jgi:hypothetical protein